MAHHLRINFELRYAHVLTNFQAPAKTYSLQVAQNTPQVVRGVFEGENVNLTEDFVATFDLDKAGSDTLAVITHRNPFSGQPSPTETAPVRNTNEPGFFAVDALLGFGANHRATKDSPTGATPTKTVVILFDTSFSMQWEKLERSYRALETLLHALRPEDKFNLILFNSQVQPLQRAPVAADSNNVQHALDFVRASRLRGGTDLQKALREALRESGASGGNPYLVLLSDGGATEDSSKTRNWRPRTKRLAAAARSEPAKGLHLRCG